MDSESLMGPPPLTPPLKGEGGAGVSESPSPLRGGVGGGGPGEAGKNNPYENVRPAAPDGRFILPTGG